ncbi:MAG: efflux RND transporter periplasmic adaptor subunit [bacterium]
MNIFNLLLKLVNLLIIIIVILIGYKWWNHYGQQTFFPNNSETKEIKVASAKRGKIKYQIVASGKVSSDKIKKIQTKTSGIVKLLSCKEGDKVKAGDVLCIIKSPTIFGNSKEIEKALFHKRVKVLENYLRKTYNNKLEALESAQINYHSTLEKYSQLKLLYQEKAISKQELTESEIAFKRAEFQYHSAKFAFEQELELSRVIAPGSGTIILNRVTEGTEVETGSELFLLADMSSLIAKVVVDEADIEKVKIGQKVEISGESFAPLMLSGVVEKIGAYAYQSERGFPGIEVICRINLNKEVAKLLILESSCIAKIIIEEKENALCIPSIALLANEKETQVFVVDNSQVHLKKVKIGIITQDLVEITDGLKEGEKVVTIGSLDLQPGDYVKIKK